MTLRDAQARRLFSIPNRQITARATERPIGSAPVVSVKAYWLGASTNDRQADTVVEYSMRRSARELAAGLPATKDLDAYVVFYEHPSQRGRSSALPNNYAPEGEIQITSEPITGAHAKRALLALDGVNGDQRYPAFPRYPVTIASGENANLALNQFEGPLEIRESTRVPGFFVITETTLINVMGWVTREEAFKLGSQLRPIG